MSSISFYVTKRAGFLVPYLQWAETQFDTLPGGIPLLGRFNSQHRDQRSAEANAKMWAMLGDISKQLLWGGKKWTAENWKDCISAHLKHQKFMPGIEDGIVALGTRTREFTQREMGEMIEFMYAFGAEQGVEWTEPKQAEPA